VLIFRVPCCTGVVQPAVDLTDLDALAGITSDVALDFCFMQLKQPWRDAGWESGRAPQSPSGGQRAPVSKERRVVPDYACFGSAIS